MASEGRQSKFTHHYEEIKRRRTQLDFALSQYRHACRQAQDDGFNVPQLRRVLSEERLDSATQEANAKEYELYRSWVFGTVEEKA